MSPRPRALAATTVALAISTIAAAEARANNGVALISASTKSYGRGGAEAAIGDDALTQPSNPATIMESTSRLRIDGSLTLATERVRTTTLFKDEVETNVLGAPFPSAGIVWDPLAADPTEENPTPAPSRVRVGFVLWQPIALAFSPSISFAGQVNDWLSLGVMISPLITYLNLTITGTAGGGSSSGEPDFLPNGSVFVHRDAAGNPLPGGPEPFDAGTGTQVTWADIFRVANGVGFDPSVAPPKPNLIIDIVGTTGFGIQGQIGALAKPAPDLAIGLSLRSPGVIFSPKGTATVDLSGAIDAIRANPQIGALLDAALETYLPAGGSGGYEAEYDLEGSNIVIPWVATLGLSWRPHRDVLLATDLKWIAWTSASGEITLEGQKGSNADFNEINGGAGIDYTVELEWDDQFVIAVGAVWSPIDWLALRVGYNYGRNPVSKDFLLGNSIGTEQHLTFGAGFLVGNWELDLAYIYGLPYQVEYSEVSQASTSEQHILVLGCGYRF